MTSNFTTETVFSVFRSSLRSPLTYLRFFTHSLGHSGWEHFMGNASFLLLLGPILEEKYGSRKLVEVILLTSLVSGLLPFVFFPHIMLCGASGVVFAFILLTSFTTFREGEIPLSVVLVALIFIGKQVYDGMTIHDNISNSAHILGGIVGAAFGYVLNKKAGKHL